MVEVSEPIATLGAVRAGPMQPPFALVDPTRDRKTSGIALRVAGFGAEGRLKAGRQAPGPMINDFGSAAGTSAGILR